MKYYFHASAKTELFEAVNYYEERQAGLGLEFAKEIYATINEKNKSIQFEKIRLKATVKYATLYRVGGL